MSGAHFGARLIAEAGKAGPTVNPFGADLPHNDTSPSSSSSGTAFTRTSPGKTLDGRTWQQMPLTANTEKGKASASFIAVPDTSR